MSIIVKPIANIFLRGATFFQTKNLLYASPISSYLPDRNLSDWSSWIKSDWSSWFKHGVLNFIIGKIFLKTWGQLTKQITPESSAFSLKNVLANSYVLYSAANKLIEYLPGILDYIPNSTAGKVALLVPLYIAGLYGVKKVFETNSNISSVTPRALTLLEACSYGTVQQVQEILEKGININERYSDIKVTALYAACCRGDSEIVKLLLSHKDIDVNLAEEQFGLTPLMIACIEGYTEVAKLLLSHKDINAIHQRDNIRGYNALLYASERGHIDIVKLFCDGKGPLPEVKCFERESGDTFKMSTQEQPKEFSCTLDISTNNLYATNNRFWISAKSFLHFTLTPVHVLYVTVKNLVFIPIDAGKVALRIFREFGQNLKSMRIASSITLLGKSIVTDIPKTIAKDIWNLARIPFYSMVMLLGSVYGILGSFDGLKLMNNLSSSWQEDSLLKLLNLRKVGNISDKIDNKQKFLVFEIN